MTGQVLVVDGGMIMIGWATRLRIPAANACARRCRAEVDGAALAAAYIAVRSTRFSVEGQRDQQAWLYEPN